MELFAVSTPKTAENFRCLCTGEKGKGKQGKRLHYRKCMLHRVVPDFIIQGGDFIKQNGLGGESIYGETLEDESLSILHDKPGLLSMANKGTPNSGNSQFFITLRECPNLDG